MPLSHEESEILQRVTKMTRLISLAEKIVMAAIDEGYGRIKIHEGGKCRSSLCRAIDEWEAEKNAGS